MIEEKYSTGTRPILLYVISVDDHGTREEQQALSSIASFQFVNQHGQTFDYNSKLTEFMETSFQQYRYALPKLEEDAEGNYTLTLGCYINLFCIHIHTHTHMYKHRYTHTCTYRDIHTQHMHVYIELHCHLLIENSERTVRNNTVSIVVDSTEG